MITKIWSLEARKLAADGSLVNPDGTKRRPQRKSDKEGKETQPDPAPRPPQPGEQ